MAILVAVAGAVIGNATGIGGSLGWTIGSFIGNMLFGDKKVTTGPRLGDLTVQSSAYGSSIAIAFGTVRLAGNLIWSTGLKEKRHKSSAGGKGGMMGGGETQVTYTYSSSFAIGLAEGEADALLRIWADGKLIYDNRGTGSNTMKKGLKFRFYKGTEDQLRDSLIQADKGLETPAFRGLCYLVFEDLQLRDFGNRIPNITCEITFKASTNYPVIVGNPITPAKGGYGVDVGNYSKTMTLDYARSRAYQIDSHTDADFMRVFDLATMYEVRQINTDDMFGDTGFGFDNLRSVLAVCESGRIITTAQRPSGAFPTDIIAVLDPNSLTSQGYVDADNISGIVPVAAYTMEGSVEFVFAWEFLTAWLRMYDPEDMSLVWDSEVDAPEIYDQETINGGVRGLKGEGYGELWIITGDQYSFNSSDPLKIWRIEMSASGAVTYEQMAELYPDDLIPGETQLQSGGFGLAYDQVDGGLMFWVQSTASVTYYLKWRAGEIMWRTKVNESPGTAQHFNYARVTGNTFGYMHNTHATLLDSATGEIIEEDVPQPIGYDPPPVIGSYGFFDSTNNSMVVIGRESRINRYFFKHYTGNGELVSNIVEALCGRVGLPPTDLDVTDLTDDVVPGFLIGRQVAVRDGIQPLATTFFFDGVESDYLLKFVQRGSNSIRTITEDEMGILDDQTKEPIQESRIQEVELPMRISIAYMERDKDYAPGVQSDKRLREPTPSNYSDNNLGFGESIVFTADFAKKVAQVALYSAWVERNTYKTQLAWKHIDLDPTDVITLTLDSGATFIERIVQIDSDVSYQMEVSGVSQQAAQYVSTASGDTGTGQLEQIIPGSLYTKLLLLDTPLLRDTDEPPGRVYAPMYYFMGGYGEGWTAGQMYKSVTGTGYVRVGQTASPMTWGTTMNVMPDPPFNEPFLMDNETQLKIAFAARPDDLASVTYEELLSGANAAILFKTDGDMEIFQFMTVTENDVNSVTLSGLFRGRRGTDTMSFGHTVGEIFLLLDPADGDIHSLTLSELNAMRYYRGVGSGSLVEDAETVPKTSIGRALMPYAPHAEKVVIDTGNNDLDITWLRRTRVGGQLRSGTGDVPLNEDTEEYELDILDPLDGSVLRTITGLTVPEYTYTAAQQASDGFTPPLSELTLSVYQISAQVGRGFSRAKTIEVVE